LVWWTWRSRFIWIGTIIKRYFIYSQYRFRNS